jgi:hypothetical protein
MAKVKIIQIAIAGSTDMGCPEYAAEYLDDKGRVWVPSYPNSSTAPPAWTQLDLPDEPKDEGMPF